MINIPYFKNEFLKIQNFYDLNNYYYKVLLIIKEYQVIQTNLKHLFKNTYLVITFLNFKL